jgi:lipid-A-disaccharide synthase-like uncharacterized protein
MSNRSIPVLLLVLGVIVCVAAVVGTTHTAKAVGVVIGVLVAAAGLWLWIRERRIVTAKPLSPK